MRGVLGAVLAAVLAVLLSVTPGAPAHAAPGTSAKPVVPCSRGLVALTFDDGPSTSVTPRIVRLLDRLDVPATFFMVGSRITAAPGVARQVERAGFAIGNHTWIHTDLTTQTDGEIRHAMGATHQAMVRAGLHPTRLARPPYGAINDRVRGVLAGQGLVPVLWTIDSRDWTGLSPQQIRDQVVSAVRPHRINVVLQHDGVTNSPATLAALPGEVATLRQRGYCFTDLDAHGKPTPPVPVPSLSTDVRRVEEGDRVHLTVRLDRPTSRPTVVRVDGFGSRTVRFPVGDTVAHLRIRVPRDQLDEAPERVRLTAGSASTSVVVRDTDPPPVARLVGTSVTASALVETEAEVGVRLDHRSGQQVRVLVRFDGRRSWVSLPAGTRSATLTVPIPVGRPDDPPQSLVAEIVRAVHAEPGGSATVTIEPPPVGRAQIIAAVRWPVVDVRSLGF